MRFTMLAAVGVLLVQSAVYGGGALVVCDDVTDPATLDPHKQFSEKNHTIVQQIFDGLVRFDPEGKIEPALAVKWEYAGGNPTRMRFTLRQGVKFHNGEPFNAAAVKYSIERYLNPKTGFPAASFLSSITSCEVVDDHTVDIVTANYPDGLLLNRLAGFVLIVPPQYIAEKGEAALHEHPVGTGAFKFEAWEKGKEIRLVANHDYWLAGYPKLDSLTFRFIPADQQAKELLKGNVDLVTELPGTMTMAVESNKKTRINKHRAFWTISATMNTASGPLADVRVRQAMNMAIDRNDLIKFDSMGNGAPLASITSPGEGGHNPDLKAYPFDPAAANKLLDEAGVQRPLVLNTLVRTQSDRASRIIAAQLAKVGIKLDIKGVCSDMEIMQRIHGPEGIVLAIGGGPDPMCHSFFMQSIMLFSKSPFSLLNDAQFDQQLLGVMTETNPQKRDAIARQLDAYIHDNALSLFTYQRIKTYGQRRGVEFTPYISTMPYFFAATAAPAEATLSASDTDPSP